VLTGAAVIREREHGTLEHLLVMPLSSRRDRAREGLGQRLVILIATMMSLF
jgi:ABC-2 type transport system permease protein